MVEKIITVKNAQDDLDTQAKIIHEAKIDYVPKVSVIIPVYNTEKYLRQCLDSVVNQTLKEIEIICVDDGSTDSSLEILKEYAQKDNRFTILTQENLHAGVARNAGLAVAKGEYLSFLDSDDWFELDMLDKLVKVSKKEKSQVIVCQYTNYNNIENKSEDIRGINKEVLNKDINSFDTKKISKNLFTLCNPMPWNKFFRRDFIVKENILFQSLTACNDVYFSLLAMAKSNKITFCKESFIYYRHNRINSLKNTRDKNPFCFYDAYKGLYNRLKQDNLYELYKQAFITSLVSSCLWTFRNTCEKQEAVKEFIIKNIVPEFDILNVGEKILSRDLFNDFFKIINTITVSLTSFPARIQTTHIAIESILKQTLKPNRVILWLAEEQFPNKEADLPQNLLNLKEQGLTIEWCNDIKSYKKLIPTLKKYPNDIIITADDDLIFDENWLKLLVESYINEPNLIHCHRITRLYESNNKLKVLSRDLYLDKQGYYEPVLCKPSAYNKLSGGAGTLYPPYCFDDDVLNENLFTKLAPTSDDIWFWLMALKNGYKVKVVKNNQYELKYIEGTQDITLCKINDVCQLKVFYEHLNNILKCFKLYECFVCDKEENEIICKNLLAKNVENYKKQLASWYKRDTKEDLDLVNPKTFNEKIQWLKLYDSTPIKTQLADKYLVREWVKEKIGEEYLIPLLGVYDSFDEIDFDKLPNQFVIKCNHGCAYNIIVKNKGEFNKDDAKEKVNKWMSVNFAFRYGVELHYKNIEPKIIIEQFIENKKSGGDLYDYKFWCFNGKVEYIQFLSERNTNGLKMAFYDKNWNKQKFVYSHPLDEKNIEKPNNLDKMIALAEKLADGFNHVRVDFYRLDNGQIYFGEMTFTSASGSCKWNIEAINKKFGKKIKLPKITYNVDTGEYYKLPFPWKYYLQNIFSLKNDHRGTHKILTVLGLRLKYKRKQKGKLECWKEFFL